MNAHPKGISLLWRILLSTSIAITSLFAVTGWVVQTYAVRVSQRSLEEEVRTSLEAYQASWGTRARTVAAMGRIISSMSDVRAAFMTRDQATIRDTAQQLWSQISEQGAVFLVLDPTGKVITSLGGSYPDLAIDGASLESALKSFPTQVAGYLERNSRLYYVVLTPIYVESSSGRALLNILLVAINIDDAMARTLKSSTHGSDFVFAANGQTAASTLRDVTAEQLASGSAKQGGVRRISLMGSNYLALATPLDDTERHQIGSLYIIRSFIGPEHALTGLQRNVALIWLAAIILGIGLTYLLAKRLLEPVKRLDQAAVEVIKQNYDYRVPVESDDELGRLADTFNAMCKSIRNARNELIQQERIATVGRFAASIVHDLRSPLAAIYGGSEMLVDTDLSAEQTQRLARNMYRASRRIQELLQELTDAGRSKGTLPEVCKLADLVNAGRESGVSRDHRESASIAVDVPDRFEVPAERSRLERVFTNLIENAQEAMPEGGSISVRAWQDGDQVITEIRDTGPGLSPEAWEHLFQPFASFGKRSGLGLGLALSRQTVLDHNGDLWAEKHNGSGAVFYLRLPLASTQSTVESGPASNGSVVK